MRKCNLLTDINKDSAKKTEKKMAQSDEAEAFFRNIDCRIYQQ
jgi:hypothetical protein